MGTMYAESDYGDTVESQLTLGTASLLGIFFGLVMVCGIFFGFGYSMGRRNAPALAATSSPTMHTAPAPVAAPVMAQPAPVSMASLTPDTSSALSTATLSSVPSSAPIDLPATTLPATTLVAVAPKLTAREAAQPPINKSGISQPKPAFIASHSSGTITSIRPAQGASVTVMPATTADHAYIEPKARIAKPSAIQPTLDQTNTRIPLQHAIPAPQVAVQNLPTPYLVWTPPFDVHYKKGFKHGTTQTASRGPLTGVSHPAGAFATVRSTPHLSPSSPAMTVQVAALSRQDDAEVLVSALKQHGFTPSIQSGSEDALYHVEVGPFSRDVAFATRQRLIARGYNATLR